MSEPRLRSRWVRRLLLVGGIVLGASLAVGLWVRSRLSGGYLEGVLNDALMPASRGLYRVSFEGLEVRFLRGDLRLSGLKLHLRPEAVDSLRAEGTLPAMRFEAAVNEVSIEGVELVRLVRDRELEADRLLIFGPSVRVEITPRLGVGLDEDEVGAIAGLEDSTRHSRNVIILPPETPRVRLGVVEVSDVEARLVIEGDTAGLATVRSTSVHDLDMTLERLVLDPSEPIMTQRVLFSDDAKVAFRQFNIELTTGARVTVDRFATSTRDGVMSIDRVMLDPGESEEEFLARPRASDDLIRVTTGRLQLDGIDYGALVRDFRAHVTHGSLDSLVIEVTSDKQKIQRTRTGPGFMPHTVFRELPLGVAIDSFVVSNSLLRYRERGKKSGQLGEVTFDPINASIANVTNDRVLMTRRTPAVIEATSRLFGVAPIHATIRMPLLSRGPTMDVTATVGAFDAKVVNRMIRSLEGVEVESGEVESAQVRINYRPGRATGEVVVIYRDLGVRLENADSRKQNFGQKLMSVAANTLLRGSNDPKPGKEPRVGKVDDPLSTDAPIFEVLWVGVRSGMLRLVKH